MAEDELAEGQKVISRYPYCISLGEWDEERKANVEDEEVRCAQELYEGFRGDEVEFAIVKHMESRIGEEMLEENLGDAEEVYKDTRRTPKTCNPMF